VPSEFDRLIHQALESLRLGWAQQARERRSDRAGNVIE
jgi:hypothetical protein